MRRASGGSFTCSRLVADSVAQTGRPVQDVMTARPVSMPSHSPRAAPALIGASRTAPPATLPNIMRGFETAAFITLSGCVFIDLQIGPMNGE